PHRQRTLIRCYRYTQYTHATHRQQAPPDMSTTTVLPNTSPAPAGAGAPINTTKNTSRVRMSISALQNLVAQDKSVLSPSDIHILNKKGLLNTGATTSASSSNTHQRTSSYTPIVGTAQPINSSFTAASSTAPRAAAFTQPSLSKGLQRVHSKAHPYHHGSKKGRPLPIYHDEVIEDTCSHLYTDLHAYNAYTNIPAHPGFRRYSDSSRPFFARGGAPVANDTMADLSHSRRASIATTQVPVIRTPEGTRTVLYQDAHGHTLLSLPTKATGTGVGTAAMDAFQFPAMNATPSHDAATAASPRLPSLSPSLSASPSPRMRSKRKSSVPIRSPSSRESQDTSPGVIFQLPFGIPPLAVPRKTSTSSCSTSSSSSTRSGSDTPPVFCSYPTPVTTGKIAFAAEGEARPGESTQSRFPTPTSPMDRSGLGIHVQKMFTEAGATHPLESSSAINEGTEVQQQRKPITFTEQDSGASIGDIVIAEQSFAAAAAAAQTHGDLTQQGNEIMPTPPPTSTIMSRGVMPGAPPGSHTDRLITSPRILLTLCNSAPQPNSAENEDEKQEDQDPSSLPLREQRLLSIRRRSLIPRQDLDFVRGSGILPPASTDLVTRGGAKILSYSVLLSDVVNVQKESMKTQEGDSEDEEPAPVITKGKYKPKPKRKRAGTGRKIQAGAKGQRSQGHDPSADGNEEYDDEDEAEGSLSADEYDDRDHHEDDDEHFQRGGHQHGYMSVSSHKRPRVDPATAGSLKPTRTVLERHGASTYKRSNRRLSNSSPSPTMSPRMSTLHTASSRGSSAAMAEYSHDQDLDIGNRDYDMEDVEIQVDDDNDDDDTLGNGGSSEHGGSRPIPEELRIPAAEVKVVMKLTREMLQAEERLNLNQVQKVARNNNRRPSIKTPKATSAAAAAAAAVAAERKNSTGDAAPPTKKPKSTPPKSSTKAHIHPFHEPASKTASSAGGSKAKEGKAAKECEACKQKETPCWRPGYTPGGSLCNSCGLRYKKSGVFCPKDGCKYIPLKTEYASMEEERLAMNKDHLKCRKCHGRVELPTR
ncbi:DNA-binding transcription repressor, partial [Mortierella alpina]